MQRTRFVVGLERPVDFQVSALPNPNRVVVDLPDVKLSLPQEEEWPAGLVQSFRQGLSAPGRRRIVIHAIAPVVVERKEIEKDGRHHRLVLEIAPLQLDRPPPAPSGKKLAPPPFGLGANMVQPPVPQRAEKNRAGAAQFYKPTIVIDPGHGGDDSGAIKNGIVEKEAVLAFSKALRDKLEARGQYRVLMTRDSDVFVPLDDRRRFAEQHDAQLFIAVHADYARSHARGATIYSLKESTANALRRSAKTQMSETVLTSPKFAAMLPKAATEAAPVRTILADLVQREVESVKEATSDFATRVIEFMGGSTSMRENADREANFVVLKTAKMPAVLIELAYVTNPEDALNLKSDSWRDRVSDSIATAIDNYFADQVARLPM